MGRVFKKIRVGADKKLFPIDILRSSLFIVQFPSLAVMRYALSRLKQVSACSFEHDLSFKTIVIFNLGLFINITANGLPPCVGGFSKREHVAKKN